MHTFESLDQQFQVEPGTVAAWSKLPGFPVADQPGVAELDAVLAWAIAPGGPMSDAAAGELFDDDDDDVAAHIESRVSGFPGGPVIIEEGNPGAVSEAVEKLQEPVEFVTIEIPFVRSSSRTSVSKVIYNLRARDADLKNCLGQMLDGARRAGVGRMEGWTDLHRFILAAVVDAIEASKDQAQ